ncbi:hypothetical protein AMJ86_02235 [bacterium SM23_57]|nr:MAG: hypothetical protein AMJ86_02235 [bacterium SM23_57]
MTPDKPIIPFDWFANQFTSENCEELEFIEQIRPHLRSILKPGDCVLDLCCGAGPIAFFLEEQGAYVTGIDQAPYLIALARQEAIKRGSRVNFIQADVLTHPLGKDQYDLAVCFGNAILDFPHQRFPQFRDRVFHALKSGGHFIIEYIDGLLRVAHMSEPKEVVEHGLDSQILRRFTEYDPVTSTIKMEYRHLSSNETYHYTGYIYTGPLIRISMETRFDFVRSIQLEKSFMDIYIKRQAEN